MPRAETTSASVLPGKYRPVQRWRGRHVGRVGHRGDRHTGVEQALVVDQLDQLLVQVVIDRADDRLEVLDPLDQELALGAHRLELLGIAAPRLRLVLGALGPVLQHLGNDVGRRSQRQKHRCEADDVHAPLS
jgi:hypothetical protein